MTKEEKLNQVIEYAKTNPIHHISEIQRKFYVGYCQAKEIYQILIEIGIIGEKRNENDLPPKGCN